MGTLAIIVMIFLIMLHSQLPILIAKISLPIHEACLSGIPQIPFTSEYAAIVCGQNLSNSSLAYDLKLTGLIHLLVVSGSHLAVLESILERLLINCRFRNHLIAATLSFYALATHVQAPIIRALLSRLLKYLNERHRFFWSPVQIVLFSGLLSLALFPTWINSLSLILSWTSTLAIALSHTFKSPLLLQTIIYLALLPVLLLIGAPHPFSILCNLLLGPLLGLILFPLSLAAYFLNPLYSITNLLWQALSYLLNTISPWLAAISPLESLQPNSYVYLWSYLLTLNLGVYIFTIRTTQPKSHPTL